MKTITNISGRKSRVTHLEDTDDDIKRVDKGVDVLLKIIFNVIPAA